MSLFANGVAVFFIQVCPKSYYCSVRSDNRCLLLLPQPEVIFMSFVGLCASISLLICGDVESNPGPEDQLTLQETCAASIKGQGELKNQLQSCQARLETLEKDVKSVANLGVQISSCGNKITALENTVAVLTSEVDDLENRCRRSNLIINGLP